MNWENLREEEFKGAIERSGGLCVLPLGCLEKHSQHCPVGTDPLKAVAIAEEAAKMEDVMIFPTGPWLGDVFGAHNNRDPIGTRSAGFIALNPRTLLDILEQLCDEIARNGFRKILILNSHGGNWPVLSYFLRCQDYNRKSYATMYTNVRCKTVYKPDLFYEEVCTHRSDYPMLTAKDMEVLKFWAEKGTWGGGHADFTETASIMGYYPELIATDRLDAEVDLDTHRSDYLTNWGITAAGAWGADHPNAMHGYVPFGVSQTIGQAMNTLCARHLAKMFKMLKEDEECVRIATRQPPVK